MMSVELPKKIGDVIGPSYHILHARSGALGIVYFCIDSKNDRYIAIKTFRGGLLDDPTIRNTFIKEIEIWAFISGHPNIVECFGVDVFNDRQYLILEWVINPSTLRCSLKDYLEIKKIPVNTALRYCDETCRAIIYAQNKVPGFVHCDIHPGNILIDHNDIAKLTDFGLAKSLNIQTELGVYKKSEGDILDAGHVNYLAPERWNDKSYDQQADIYSIGCVLYEMITGKIAFLGDSVADIRIRHEASNRPTISTKDKLSSSINDIIQGCIARDQDDRWDTIVTLYNAIKDLCSRHAINLTKSSKERSFPGYLIKSNKAVTLANIHEYEKALTIIDEAIKENPNCALLYAHKALIFQKTERLEKASLFLQKAIEQDDEDPLFYNNLGIIKKNQNLLEEASDCYKKAIELDDKWELPHINLGNLYYLQNETEKAIFEYTKAIEINPGEGELYFQRALFKNELGINPELILGEIEIALKLNPSLSEAYIFRGNLLRSISADNISAAIADYSAALEIHQTKGNDPKFRGAKLHDLVLAYMVRSSAYQQIGDFTKAISDINKAIENDPNRKGLYYLRGRLYRMIGNEKLAVYDFERCEELSSIDIIETVDKADDLMNAGKYKEAIVGYSDIIDHYPEISDTYTNRGIAYKYIGEFKKAYDDFQTALNIDPFDCDVLYNLGLLCFQKGDKDEAYNYLRRAADLGDEEAKTYLVKWQQFEIHRELIVLGMKVNERNMLMYLLNSKTIKEFIQVIRNFPECLEHDFMKKLSHLLKVQNNDNSRLSLYNLWNNLLIIIFGKEISSIAEKIIDELQDIQDMQEANFLLNRYPLLGDSRLLQFVENIAYNITNAKEKSDIQKKIDMLKNALEKSVEG